MTISTNLKVKIKKVAYTVSVAFLFQGSLQAQTLLSTKDIIEQVKLNSVEIQNIEVDINKANEIRKNIEFPKTSFLATMGQYNTILFDNSFTLSQNFALPTVYKKQKNLGESAWQLALEKKRVVENDVVYKIRELCLDIQYLHEVANLLRVKDTLLDDFEILSNIRYQAGAGGALERMMAEAQREENHTSLRNNYAQLKQKYSELSVLINLKNMVQLKDSLLSKKYLSKKPEHNFDSNPNLILLDKESEYTAQNINVEKTKLLPDFSIGYFNQSLSGWQTINNSEKYFNVSYRFQGATLGINLPLYQKSIKSTIKSWEYERSRIGILKERQLNNLGTIYAQLVERVNQLNFSLSGYETKLLPLAIEIRKLAKKNYEAGEIDYVEFTQASQQALDIQRDYIEQLLQYHKVDIQMKYLVGDN